MFSRFFHSLYVKATFFPIVTARPRGDRSAIKFFHLVPHNFLETSWVCFRPLPTLRAIHLEVGELFVFHIAWTQQTEIDVEIPRVQNRFISSPSILS